MKLTKYAHACFTVEQDGQLLVVDPGNFSNDFVARDNVVAVVITHEHGDHSDADKLAAIMNKNPQAIIFAHPSITATLPRKYLTKSVQAGSGVTVGPFTLEFFGGQHALIHASIPAIPNLGVMINNTLYYPGDSFSLPGDHRVDVLALPAAAPWMKLGEAMDFLATVKPRLAFPTHDALLSDAGKSIADRLLLTVAKQGGSDYRRLTEPLEL